MLVWIDTEEVWNIHLHNLRYLMCLLQLSDVVFHSRKTMMLYGYCHQKRIDCDRQYLPETLGNLDIQPVNQSAIDCISEVMNAAAKRSASSLSIKIR